jgi:hypothetical protein
VEMALTERSQIAKGASNGARAVIINYVLRQYGIEQ